MPSCFHQRYHLSCIASASRLTHPASACSEQVHTLSWLSVPGNLSAHSLLWRTLRCFTITESVWMHLGTSISCSSSTILASRCTRVFSMWLDVHPGMWVSLLLYQANVSLQSLHSFSNLLKNIYLFIWLHQFLVAAPEIYLCSSWAPESIGLVAPWPVGSQFPD